MFNLLRMDMYQTFKGSLFWTFAGIVIALTFGTSFTLWFVGTQLTNDAANGSISVDGLEGSSDPSAQVYEMTQIDAMSNTLLGGGLLILVIPLFAALLITSEFNSGFIKNVYTAGVSRTSYFISKVVTIIVAALALTVLGIASSLLSFAVFGLTFYASPVGEIIAWGACIAALIAVLALLIALVAWFSRSKVASVLVAVFISTGLIVGVLSAVLSNFPSLAGLTDYTVYSTLVSLSSGLYSEYAFSPLHIVGVGGISFLIYAGLSYLTVKIKDV